MSTNCLAKLVKKFTGSVRTLRTRTNYSEGEEGEITPLLIDDLSVLDDFVRNDPEDTIFEEYDSPFPPETPFEWKSRRPSILKSVIISAWTVLQLIILGILIGTLGFLFFYIDINTADFCHWVPLNKLPKIQQSIRVGGEALKVFLIDFWQFLILCTIFEWPLLKELNLLTITMFGAFVDVCYRLVLHLCGTYKPPWVPYPSNALFVSLILYNSYAVGRKMSPESISKAIKLAFKLCAQFIIGAPVGYFLNYVAFPWFEQAPPGIKRAMIAAMVPMSALPGKIVSRIGAIHLEGINHPGTSHAIVATIYGASSIVFRTFQARIQSFELFVAMSIGHGIVYIIERLTVPLRDYYCNKLLLSFFSSCRCAHCRHQRQQYNVRSPRSQRLTADMSIQGILFESTATVYSIGILFTYYLVYGTSENKWTVVRLEVTQRVLVALAVEFVFNSISVLFQTRYMNIPVIRVWRRNWKKHLILAFITTTLVVSYFTLYQLPLIRKEYSREIAPSHLVSFRVDRNRRQGSKLIDSNDNFPLMGNCTKPFNI